MTLEQTIKNMNKQAEQYINQAPFVMKLLYSSELKQAKKILKETSYVLGTSDSEKKYLDLGTQLNKTRNTIYDFIDKTYDVVDLVKNLEGIPIIGKWAQNYQKKMMAKYGIKKIPDKEKIYNVVDKTYDVGLEMVCATAEASTGKDSESYKAAINSRRGARANKSNVVSYVSKAISAIRDLCNEVFYSSSDKKSKSSDSQAKARAKAG